MRSLAHSARVAVLLSAAAGALASGCAAPRASHARLLDVPGASARCRVGSGRTNPLVTEWPASEKANLEAMLRRGAVAVEYSGCAMRVLTECRLRGGYAWQRTTPASDVVEIGGEEELYVKLPLGAASLEGELERSGKLSIHTYVSGQLRLEGASAADVPPVPACARATHVVGALAVGAFQLDGSGKASGRADVGLARLGSAGGKVERSAGLIRSAGDADACDRGDDAGPHPNCRSPIQVFLWPIPGRAPEEGPPGTVKVDVVSANAISRWDVYYDDEVICTTPCTRWLDPAHPIFLRSREERFLRTADKVRVLDLADYADSGAVQLHAHPTAEGKLATGISFTALGGTAVFAGLALAAIGCGDGTFSSAGMCSGGLTTFGTGALVTASAVWLILDALPRAELRPGGAPSPGRGYPVSVSVGPGFVAGRF
jgi:hypothetical protein